MYKFVIFRQVFHSIQKCFVPSNTLTIKLCLNHEQETYVIKSTCIVSTAYANVSKTSVPYNKLVSYPLY